MRTVNISRNDSKVTRRASKASPRARRFPLQLPARYRIPPSPQWFEARTENVSHSGVLFRTKSICKPTTIVEVRLEFPAVKRDGPHAEAVCKCEVVRVEETHGRGISPAVALAIHDYRLTRKGEPN
ncbi:MAG: PilZ domain-containing protein [Terriglobia bacterium]